MKSTIDAAAEILLVCLLIIALCLGIYFLALEFLAALEPCTACRSGDR